MKNEIDLLIKEPKEINFDYCRGKYWDIINETQEYVVYQTERKRVRINGFARKFRRKLVFLVEEARERRYQEWLRLQNLPKPERPIVVKSVTPRYFEEKVCYRIECSLKRFMTLERYQIHMNAHKEQDFLRFWAIHERDKQKEEKILTEETLKKRLVMVKSSASLPDVKDAPFYCKPCWKNLPHSYNLYRIINKPIYRLEIVSQHLDVNISGYQVDIKLENEVNRIGTHPSCECQIQLSGESAKTGKISKVHCLLYLNRAGNLTIVDNHSMYGTYVVTKNGALKVPSKVTEGFTVMNGSLICLGVTIDGPSQLPVTEANSAAVVFRLQTRY